MSKRRSFKKTVLTFAVTGILLANPLMVQAELGDEVLKLGMNNEDIKTLQEHLIDLDYLELEETTTYYGEQTAAAVAKFQEDKGLKADGVFGQDSFEALGELIYYEPLVYTGLLREGVTGSQVQALQERLRALGYLEIDNCTTFFGPQTKEAVMKFQKAYRLKLDGIVGQETVTYINKAFEKQGLKPRPASASRGGSANSTLGMNIVNTGRKFLGLPYRSAGSTPAGFDCSGFTRYVYQQNNVSVPRTSLDQARAGTKLSRSQLQVGDLVIFSGTYRSGPSHTGIYVGNGKFIHSSSGGGSVMISDLDSGYYRNHFSYGRRVF